MVSAATGGDIVDGLITGAIGGAFFGAAGSIIESMKLQGLARVATGAGIHTIAGGASGALGAVATGGDPGMSAILGGASAGASYGLGHSVPWLQSVEGDYVGNLIRRSAIGAIIGGGTSVALGGSFGRGAGYGAMTSTIGYTANEVLHEALLPGITGAIRIAQGWTPAIPGFIDDLIIGALAVGAACITFYQAARRNPSDKFEIDKLRRQEERSNRKFNSKPPKQPWGPPPPPLNVDQIRSKSSRIWEACIKLVSHIFGFINKVNSPY